MNRGPEHLEPNPPEPVLGGADELESALRATLAPREPPAAFADRVLARALAGDEPRPVSTAPATAPLRLLPATRHVVWRQWLVAGASAAAVLLGLLEGGAALRHLHQQQQRIAEATAQFQTTERVTVHALAQARQQMQRAGVTLDLD